MSRSSPETATLKPCPFCGGPAYVHETEGQRPDESSFSVHCDGCEATHATDRDRVVSAWNRRFDFAQTAQQWRPIETAPKDGTVVMIWLPHSTKMVCAYFESADKGWWVRHGAFCAENPTLWQPLPALPDTSTDRGIMEATAAQHSLKGRPAQFVRNGILETCQCLDCRALSQPSPIGDGK